MLYIVLISAILTAVYFCVRWLLLRKAVRNVKDQLSDITLMIEENRTVRLPGPDRELEALLAAINHTLEEIRHKAFQYAQREAGLKEQIEHISHDLRTPLTSVLGYLSLIDDSQMAAEDRESLETALRKAHSMQQLITQFYDLSRLNNGDYQLKPEPVDIGRLLRESVTNQYRLLSEQNLDVSVSIPELPVMVTADPAAVERIFGNLLQNAGRYARTSLSISLKQMDHSISIIFRNDTQSLSENQAAQLFQPFYTADPSRTRDHTGLGLTISRYLAESMNGTLQAVLEDEWLSLTLILNFVQKGASCD